MPAIPLDQRQRKVRPMFEDPIKAPGQTRLVAHRCVHEGKGMFHCDAPRQ